jgi:hypothetical protein
MAAGTQLRQRGNGIGVFPHPDITQGEIEVHCVLIGHLAARL